VGGELTGGIRRTPPSRPRRGDARTWTPSGRRTDEFLRRSSGLGCGGCVYSTRKHEPSIHACACRNPLDRTVTATIMSRLRASWRVDRDRLVRPDHLPAGPHDVLAVHTAPRCVRVPYETALRSATASWACIATGSIWRPAPRCRPEGRHALRGEAGGPTASRASLARVVFRTFNVYQVMDSCCRALRAGGQRGGPIHLIPAAVRPAARWCMTLQVLVFPPRHDPAGGRL
jgi:hypothetical protein